MQVEDGLARVLALVDDEAVTACKPERGGDVRDAHEALFDELCLLLVHLGEGGKVRLGHDEHVHGRLGIDVAEGEHVLVFVHLLRGDLPGADLAEQAVRIGHDISSLRAAARDMLRGCAGFFFSLII